ncbi:RNA-binding S4 domain-containing protein [Phaeobacter sp. 11ANDIMAR09]|uniref:RNA-binding S4 domain-containing protein n=1 Tax=Phaeobacter sp. 11ANDIMAR09 TaxID=1225647 RepID=UPI0006C8C820|nr:RNA-binding S4 domain-containing protein [Phaeobacter sp. 11ANDIMAR09]KPD12659.1 tRNA synthetase RNA-binding protein [Phaeobacter sp. 11ANDIMAR09]
MEPRAAKIRIDKWLWHARFFKTRSLAAKQVSAGHLRLNGTKVAKTAQNVTAGDVLSFPQGRQIRVVEVVAIGERRGPAPEAQALYLDKTPKQDILPANPRFEGKGRPDKKSRRALDLSRQQDFT